jgi:uncharacterized damage-inducible protein DinB
MLAQYKAWADKVMFDGVAALPPGEAEKERKTLFKSISLAGASRTPRARLLRAQPHAAFRIAGALNWFIDWAAAQSQASLDEDVPFTFVNGTHASMRRGETFLHLLTHSSYHRGWVAEMFLEAGARPPQPDLSVFLCEAPRDWRASI